MVNKASNLDFAAGEFREKLGKAADLIADLYEDMYDLPVMPPNDEKALEALIREVLPEQGQLFDDVLAEFAEKIIPHATLNIAPRMFAYVMSGGNQTSVIADLLVSALNQNVTKWHLAPSLTHVEKLIFEWAADFVRLPEHRAGALVSSGSAANLTGLTIGRNIFFEANEVRKKGVFALGPITVYASKETHSSVEKSLNTLGIGSDYYRKIPVNADFTIDLDLLEAAIKEDVARGYKPFCLVGNAGTVNTGAIDPLDRLADLAATYGLWFHVDGAYGGLAKTLVSKNELYRGLERADSIALDFHKWLYQPFEIGCTLVRNWQDLRRTYYTSADYLDVGDYDASRFNITEHHFSLSRNGKALKVWMSLKQFGAIRVRAMIQKDIDLTGYLSKTMGEASDFECVTEGPLAICCFRYIPEESFSETELNDLNADILSALEEDRRIFITGTKLFGKHVMRACLINHRMQERDIDYLVTVVREVARKIVSKRR